jgi:hypothetical protein
MINWEPVFRFMDNRRSLYPNEDIELTIVWTANRFFIPIVTIRNAWNKRER